MPKELGLSQNPCRSRSLPCSPGSNYQSRVITPTSLATKWDEKSADLFLRCVSSSALGPVAPEVCSVRAHVVITDESWIGEFQHHHVVITTYRTIQSEFDTTTERKCAMKALFGVKWFRRPFFQTRHTQLRTRGQRARRLVLSLKATIVGVLLAHLCKSRISPGFLDLLSFVTARTKSMNSSHWSTSSESSPSMSPNYISQRTPDPSGSSNTMRIPLLWLYFVSLE